MEQLRKFGMNIFNSCKKKMHVLSDKINFHSSNLCYDNKQALLVILILRKNLLFPNRLFLLKNLKISKSNLCCIII